MNEPYPRNYERQNAMITTLAAPYSHTSTMFGELSEHAKEFRLAFAALMVVREKCVQYNPHPGRILTW